MHSNRRQGLACHNGLRSWRERGEGARKGGEGGRREGGGGGDRDMEGARGGGRMKQQATGSVIGCMAINIVCLHVPLIYIFILIGHTP